MNNYEKPAITEEVIALEDIIAVSNLGTYNNENEDYTSLEDLFPKL